MSEIDTNQDRELQQGPETTSPIEAPLETALAPSGVVDVAAEQQGNQPVTSPFLESLGHTAEPQASTSPQTDPTPEPEVEREPFVRHQPTSNETTPESATLRRVATGNADLSMGDIPGLSAENVRAVNELLDRQGSGPEGDARRAMILRSLERVATSSEFSRAELTEHRSELVNSLAREITRPQDTHQGVASSCVATTMAIRLQRENPAEYARIVASLSVDGEVTLAGGGTMRMYQGAGLIPDRSQGEWPGRSVSESVFQNSAMNFVSQYRDPQSSYDNVSMQTHGPGGNYGGMYQDQGQYLHNQLFGTGSQRLDTSNSGREGSVSPQEATRQIETALETQSGVPVELNWASSGSHMNHEVLVTQVTEDRVYIRNPHHHQSSNGPQLQQDADGNYYMSRTEFESRLQSAIIDDPDRHPADIQEVEGGTYPTQTVEQENGQEMIIEFPNISPLTDIEELSKSIDRIRHKSAEEVEQKTARKGLGEAEMAFRRKDDEPGYEEEDIHQRRERKEQGDDDEGPQPFVTPKDIQ